VFDEVVVAPIFEMNRRHVQKTSALGDHFSKYFRIVCFAGQERFQLCHDLTEPITENTQRVHTKRVGGNTVPELICVFGGHLLKIRRVYKGHELREHLAFIWFNWRLLFFVPTFCRS
jgi:hypothetical protein